MRMIMELIAERGHFAILILTGWLSSAVVTVLVAVMPEMCGMIRRVPQHIANAHRRRIGGIQREHDGKNEREINTHGASL